VATRTFITEEGITVPSVTEEQMREIDRIVVEDFGLGILQMMENAGRNLALTAMEMVSGRKPAITILAGSGGNGGGGICCARHLYNRGYQINLLLTKEPKILRGSAKTQLNILTSAGFQPSHNTLAEELIQAADLVIDALIGYSLNGAPRGQIAEFIRLTNLRAKKTLSLDIPSGIDSTTGETPGVYVKADRTLTLALPKPGLHNPSAGDIYLADIGIPPEIYRSLGIVFDPFFGNNYRIPLKRSL
jgi:NAD(P)H-hydrate epimerase